MMGNRRRLGASIMGAVLVVAALHAGTTATSMAAESPSGAVVASAEPPPSVDASPVPGDEDPGRGTAIRFVMYLTIFVLAVFIGFEVITKIPPTLHTPLMSGSNAISGIALVGAILCSRSDGDWNKLTLTLGFFAIIFATVNVVGGFLVTNRMLSMFRKRGQGKKTRG